MNRRKKILVVEDDPGLQGLIYRGLKSYEVEVLQAHNSLEAEKLFAEHEDIDLVLLDGCLDGDNPDGAGLVHEFKVREALPILAMSSSRDLRHLMVEQGCTGEVEKIFAARTAARLLGFTAGE